MAEKDNSVREEEEDRERERGQQPRRSRGRRQPVSLRQGLKAALSELRGGRGVEERRGCL